MIELREPKYKVGDKVIDKKGHVGNVMKVDSYHFDEDEYWYNVRSDEGIPAFYTEPYLDPYVEKPKTIWDLKEGDTYYSIYGNGNVSSEEKWFDDDYENHYREIGNVFLTREEAEFEVERRKVETEMLRLGGRRTFKKGEDNHGIDYCEGLGITLYHYQFVQGLIYFDTRKEAENAIKKIGEYRIEKYIFGVE